jgi:hypothetical protein
MMLADFRVADDMAATASKAARTILSALELAEIGGPKEYGEALLFCFPDSGSEFQQRVVVVGNGFQKAIPIAGRCQLVDSASSRGYIAWRW